jgi:hypothetical protein
MSEHNATTKAAASPRPTRMIRARDLAVGDIVLWECVGKGGCQMSSTVHTSSVTAPVFHELTMYDIEAHDGNVSAIVVTESGEQSALRGTAEHAIMRVYADTPARAGQSQS